MAKRYFANIVSVSGKKIAFEIWNEDFAGEAKELEVSADTLTLTQSGEHLFDAVRATAGSIVVTSKTNFEFQDMMLEDDLANVVKIYEDSSLIFSGYIENGMYEEEYLAPPYDVQICFTDGLKKLKGLFVDTDVVLDKMYYNLIELIRECLYPIMLPNKNGDKHLYVNCSLHNDAFKNDINWGCLEQVFMHASAVSGDNVSFYDLIEKLLELFGAMVYQYNGDWYIERIKNKLNDGNVTFIRYDLSKPFSAIDNRGTSIIKNGLNVIADDGSRYITETPKYTTEKEYRYQELDVDTTLKNTLISTNFSLNKQRPVCETDIEYEDTELFFVEMIYSDDVVDEASRMKKKRAPYVWYWPSEIKVRDQKLMQIEVIKNYNTIKNGIKFNHQTGNNLLNHVHNETPCHVMFGSTVNFKMKVHIDLTADSITKKTWVIIPIRFNNIYYTNTTDYPYDGYYEDAIGVVPVIGSYVKNSGYLPVSARLIAPEMTTASNPKDGGYDWLPGVYLVYNSETDAAMFKKWYNDEAVEVSFSLYNSGWLNPGGIEKQQKIELTLFPTFYSDTPDRIDGSNQYDISTDVSKIRSSAYGDIEVNVETSSSIECGYTVKNIGNEKGYQIKREAPRISLKYWEGAPIFDSKYDATNMLLSCYYTNFQLKYLLLSPLFDDIYTKDSNGNITGINLVDNVSMNIDVVNTRKVDSWYDKNKPINEYNKKCLLVERLVQDRFDSYAKTRKQVEITIHSEDVVFSSLYTYMMKHIQGAKLIATSITRNFDRDDYNMTLEEIREGAVKTTLFIPRNEIKKGIDIKTPIPGRDEWVM